MPARPRTNPFASFWMGGFECSCHINRHGERLDLLSATGHDARADSDYALLRSEGIKVARDGVRWHLIERNGTFDFSSFQPLLEASSRQDVQVVWDLCHYGWPDGLDIFSADFPRRFARFSRAIARLITEHDERPPLFIPINEISYFAWAAGHAAEFHPFGRERAPELKRQLVRAYLASVRAIREVAPQARVLTAEPLINVVPPAGRPPPDDQCPAARMHEAQFEAWDMLAGRLHPELGGAESHLDVLGVNFYPHNQWELPGGRTIRRDGPEADGRFRPLRFLLLDVWKRYRRPLFISETSCTPPGRADWLSYVTDEVIAAKAAGVPVYGVCLYPVIDRPDWEDSGHWHRSGLWDREAGPAGSVRLVLAEGYAAGFRRCRQRLSS